MLNFRFGLENQQTLRLDSEFTIMIVIVYILHRYHGRLCKWVVIACLTIRCCNFSFCLADMLGCATSCASVCPNTNLHYSIHPLTPPAFHVCGASVGPYTAMSWFRFAQATKDKLASVARISIAGWTQWAPRQLMVVGPWSFRVL